MGARERAAAQAAAPGAELETGTGDAGKVGQLSGLLSPRASEQQNSED